MHKSRLGEHSGAEDRPYDSALVPYGAHLVVTCTFTILVSDALWKQSVSMEYVVTSAMWRRAQLRRAWSLYTLCYGCFISTP